MVKENVLSSIKSKEIRNKIYTFRGKQVMTDRDLAELYHVSTKRLNEQVNRNKKRFPEKFMFQLSEGEYAFLRSHFATSSERDQHGGRRYQPYVFTEQGIAKFSEVKQHIFFDGQIYDAFSFIVDIIKKAKNKLILIDNYVDTSTLNLLCKKKNGVSVVIVSSGKVSLTSQDIFIFNSQYQGLTLKTRNDFHDRFLIIDDKEVYHIGASLKDAGKKTFGITRIEDEALIESLIKKAM